MDPKETPNLADLICESNNSPVNAVPISTAYYHSSDSTPFQGPDGESVDPLTKGDENFLLLYGEGVGSGFADPSSGYSQVGGRSRFQESVNLQSDGRMLMLTYGEGGGSEVPFSDDSQEDGGSSSGRSSFGRETKMSDKELVKAFPRAAVLEEYKKRGNSFDALFRSKVLLYPSSKRAIGYKNLIKIFRLYGLKTPTSRSSCSKSTSTPGSTKSTTGKLKSKGIKRKRQEDLIQYTLGRMGGNELLNLLNRGKILHGKEKILIRYHILNPGGESLYSSEMSIGLDSTFKKLVERLHTEARCDDFTSCKWFHELSGGGGVGFRSFEGDEARWGFIKDTMDVGEIINLVVWQEAEADIEGANQSDYKGI